MRSLIGTVCHKSMDIRELFYYLVVNIVKWNTVMYIARGYFHGKNNTVDVTGGMGLVGQLLLVVAFYEQTTVRICGTDGNGVLLRFLLALF